MSGSEDYKMSARFNFYSNFSALVPALALVLAFGFAPPLAAQDEAAV